MTELSHSFGIWSTNNQPKCKLTRPGAFGTFVSDRDKKREPFGSQFYSSFATSSSHNSKNLA